jgi:hypothetical protein
VTSVAQDYRELLDRFLEGDMSASEFQQKYLEKFKAETRWLGSPLFELLDGLFGDVDSFVADPKLLAELQATIPDFYLDEQSLRDRVAEVSRQLSEMERK